MGNIPVGGENRQRSMTLWQVLSGLLLLAMGGIHLYLVLAVTTALASRARRSG